MKRKLWFMLVLGQLAAMLLMSGGLAEAGSTVWINEACSSNKASYVLEDGSTPDWIELYNGATEAVSLDGLHLSNDEDRPQMFSLEGFTIEPQGYLILRADKKQLPFKLSASGGETLLLCDAQGQTLDAVELPPLDKDATYSRQDDGLWHVAGATPGAKNAIGEVYKKRVYVAKPSFSLAPGFYDEPISLSILADEDCKIYYTLDGSAPTCDSLCYDGEIVLRDATEKDNRLSMIKEITYETYTPPEVLIPKCNVVRAIAVDADGNESGVVTASYFIHFQNRKAFQNIGIMSIAVEEGDLFDKHTGIMMLGDTYAKFVKEFGVDAISHTKEYANYQLRGREYEREVYVEYFEPDQKEVLAQAVGLRIHGNYSRVHPEKSFTLFARSEYEFGKNVVDYAFWGNEKESKVVLRGLKSFGRDVLVHRLLDGTGVPTIPDSACMLFINGEFWGYYDIRPGVKAETIAKIYDLPPEDIIIYKNGVLDDGKETGDRSLKGDFAIFANMDMTIPENFQAFQDAFDLDSYITHLAGNAYTANTDGFKYNVTAWRTASVTSEPYQDGKWRYIFQDLDMTSGWNHETVMAASICERLKDDAMFPALWKNETFRTMFLTKIMDLGNLFFTKKQVEAALEQVYDAREEYYAETRQRFGRSRSAVNVVNDRASIQEFYANRIRTIQEDLKKSQGVNLGVHTLYLEGLWILKRMNGELLLNGYPVEAEGRWSGKYYECSTVVLTVRGLTKEDFLGWYDAEGRLLSEEPELAVSMAVSHSVYPRVRLPEENAATFEGAEASEAGWTFRNQDGSPVATLSAQGEAELSADESGAGLVIKLGTKTDQSLKLMFDTTYASAVELALDWEADNSSSQWHSEYSLDGEKWRNFGSTLKGDVAHREWRIPIPTELLDADEAMVRIVCDKHNDGAELTLIGLRMLSARQEITLSRFRTARKAIEAWSVEASVPDEAELLQLSQEEIDLATEAMLQEAISAYVDERTMTAEEFGDVEFLAFEDAPLICVDDALRGFTREVAWKIPDGYDEIWIYSWENGELTLRGQVAGAESTLIQTDKEIWLMLPQEVEKYPKLISVSHEWRDSELLRTIFHDRMPSFSLWLDVRSTIPAEREMTIDLSEETDLSRMYVYRYENGRIMMPSTNQSWRGGVMYVGDGLEAGTYLLLDQSVELYREQYEMEIAHKRNLLYVGVSAGVCVVGFLLLIILRLRKRKPAARPATPPPRRRQG